MYSLKNVGYLFWTFIFLIILLQLSTSENLVFIGALIYSLVILLIIITHENFVRKKLIKTYVANQNTTRFIIYNLSLSFFTSLCLTVVGYFIFSHFLTQVTDVGLINQTVSMFFGLLLFTILISGVSYAIELFKQKIASEKKHQELKNSVLEMEIDHLRTQLSPHFTFNILNNLQFLIRKDKDEALELLSRYSKILRYYIYESQNKWIKLDDEISFLQYYFQLEKDRSGENLQISCQMDSIPGNDLMIIPFLLSTFIENAFKHVSSYNEKDNFIHLNVVLQNENHLILTIANTFDENLIASKKPGVGLKQVKKRLDLSFPNNYKLDIKQHNGVYKVFLKLKLAK